MIWQVFGIDYGKKKTNPIDNVYFYSKNDLKKAFQIRKEEVEIRHQFSEIRPLHLTHTAWCISATKSTTDQQSGVCTS